MTVHIPVHMIEDSSIAAPTIGAVLTGPLDFREHSSADPDAVTVRGHLTPSDEKPTLLSFTGDSAPRWVWSGFLRGDGWTALWRGFTPRTGHVEVTGRFVGGYDYASDGRFRGVVTRVRIATERRRRDADGRWVIVPGHRRVRDADNALGIGRGDDVQESGENSVDLDVTVIVDLDLDDVPALAPRPSIVPGAVSAWEATIWVVDAELPLVVAVTGSQVVEYLLPSRSGLARLVWATPSGCWVAGVDGTFWLAEGGEPVRVDDRPIRAGAVNGSTLLGCTGESTWAIYRPDADPVEVAGCPGHVFSVVAHDDGFMAAVSGPRPTGTRLVRVSTTGRARVGPELSVDPEPGRRSRWRFDLSLAGDPLRLVSGTDIGVIEEDLTVRDDGERLGRRQFFGGTVGEYGWGMVFLDHDPRTPSELWPLPDRATFERAVRMLRPPRKVFVLYDPRSMTPLTCVPLRNPEPSVTIDGAGTIVVVDTGITTFPVDGAVMTPPTTLDVAALLDRSREGRRRT